jgi:hypothetical protein
MIDLGLTHVLTEPLPESSNIGFRPYLHVEKFGNAEVEGIENGDCHVFPKIDGTNASIWCENHSELKAGSRKRKLTLSEDNAGFYRWVLDNSQIFTELFKRFPDWILYGEWLVPHSLKTYREDAWRKFYCFDVYSRKLECYVHCNSYLPVLNDLGIDTIMPIAVIKNATREHFEKEIENNTFLIRENMGIGEGIVIKNYDFVNRFGETVWAKLITNQFKEKHARTMGPVEKIMKEQIETKICDAFLDIHLVDKTQAKIANEKDGWSSKYIGELLGRVQHDFIVENMWAILKKFKNPTINFKKLNQMAIIRIKELRPDLF